MFRVLLCTAALAVAFTAAHAEAGGFKLKFGGGNHGGNHSNHHHNNHHHYGHYHKVYRPVAKCYYQVCYFQNSWGYKKHRVFTCLHDAQTFAHEIQRHGCYASISKTCTPYADGYILHAPTHAHNAWMP